PEATPEQIVIPNYVIIRALDAIDNPERSDSTIKIYSATVRGNRGDNTQYYPDGSRLADFTLMADNIYANSYKAPDSNISTVAFPNGYKQTGNTYTDADFGSTNTTVHYAQGLNSIGEGGEITIDILGVDRDVVESLLPNAQRSNYVMQKHNFTIPVKFKNQFDRLAFYDYDFKANNVVVSINDYADASRDVSIDTVYANNAYINSAETNFKIEDGIITNYAEFRNKDKLGIIDNDFRRLLVGPADIQLYTAKTGSFGLNFDKTINMKTTAPTVFSNPSMLVNNYHSAWNFINRSYKDVKALKDNIKLSESLKNINDEPSKHITMIFDTTQDADLFSNVQIYNISTNGALIKNDKNLKRGKNTTINIKFDDVDIDIQAKVVDVSADKAKVEFINLPHDIANKILFRYMQKEGTMEISKK
ncbi:MAG: PilZ domain-containing protein, partial [Candidatus Gastranaerophilaceae bacterium]